MKPFVPAILAALTLGGCATFIDGERATATSEGLRYSLPAPFLMVTPKPDGTLDVTVVNLPDPDNTYTLRTRSLVSTYTLDVALENQMLKSVGMTGKSDAVASATIESLGNVRKAQIEADDKARDAAKAVDVAADKALAEAELAVTIAQNKLDKLTAAGAAADKIFEADLALSELVIKRDALLRAQSRTANARFAAADAPALNRAGSQALVPGPMLFRILPDGRGVKLVAVRGPTAFATSVAALPPAATAPAGPLTFVADANGIRKLTLTYPRPLKRADSVEIALFDNAGVAIKALQPQVTVTPGTVPATISITLAKDMVVGHYSLSLDLILADDTAVPQLYEVVVQK